MTPTSTKLAVAAGPALLWLTALTASPARAVEARELAPPPDAAASFGPVNDHVRARMADDFAALQRFRPGYSFWRHVFVVPDGSVLFGSAEDGRLLARFPTRGDWRSAGEWHEPSLSGALAGVRLDGAVSRRRDQVAELLQPAAGTIVHNPSRGDFLLPNVPRYGGFLEEWSAIYERFGVPAELGLAQAIVESGLDGNIRSEARAIGFCQWLPGNWDRLNRLTTQVIEAPNQTTQAPYCAAYLTVLATKYGSFLPALSEHHAGGANVGRTVINGERLGETGVRERYLVGADFARDLRAMSPRTYRPIIGTYGPRSYRYAEIVFANTETVNDLRATVPQERIFAMRAPRAISMTEIERRTGLSARELRRYNPALVRQVPRGADLYLPEYVAEFGKDVAFWQRPAPVEFDAVLAEFVRLEATVDEWEDPAFDNVLTDFRRRFAATDSEEGRIMAAMLGYAMQDAVSSRRVLAEFRTSPRVLSQFEEGVARRADMAARAR